MFQNWIGVPVLPNGKKLIMKVHSGNNMANAYWDGTGLTFGDGDASTYPLTILDITGHEAAHGFTENNSALIYTGQSGAINESFSDMAGEAAEYFMRGKNDFLVGPEAFKNKTSLRNMMNPPSDGYSVDHFSKNSNNLDVHYGSAFYLLATTPGWNTRKAFEVMADANHLYWTSSTSFVNAACGVEKAASVRGYAVADVNKAFQAVGTACAVPGQTTLVNGQAVSVSGLATGSSKLYTLTVPTGKTSLSFKLSSGTGNGNLYLQKGSAPTTTSYLKKSEGSTNAETMTVSNPAAGVWYLLLNAKQTVTGASLIGSYK